MKGNFHARCGRGEKMEIISKSYLSVSWKPSEAAHILRTKINRRKSA